MNKEILYHIAKSFAPRPIVDQMRTVLDIERELERLRTLCNGETRQLKEMVARATAPVLEAQTVNLDNPIDAILKSIDGAKEQPR